ncbi:tripartite tricarboxylate transporter TctB family protein [Micromonospora sp. NPDC006431]|uniref:tripartite tricarboxylate transporter TctB family protein n=1 Tax=Micromonospora sp. NPDC006431 TaxID=3364235 RepID=UPI00368F302D
MSALTRLRGSGEARAYAVLALLGLAAAAGGLSYGVFVDDGRVGPGFLPVVAGGLTALLCGWIAVRPGVERAGVTDAAEPAEAPDADDDIDITGRSRRERVRNLWAVFALTFGAILLVQVVGFLAAFAGLVFVISTWIERQSLVRSALIAALTAAVIYGVFGLFLRVPLPGGLFGLGTEG